MASKVFVSRSGSAPESVESVLEQMPERFGTREQIRARAATAKQVTNFVAIDAAGHIVGVALVDAAGEAAVDLQLIAVEPGWQRRGVGRSLLDEIARELAGSGLTELRVAHPDPAAFFSATGFSEAEGRLTKPLR